MRIPDRKVLHIQRASGIGGSERHLLSLLPSLEARGWKCKICVPVVEEGTRFVEALRSAGVETVAFPAGPHINPALALRLLHEIRRLRPDLVHTHLIHGDLYGQIAARLAGIPAVSSVHSTLGFYRSEPYRSASRFAWRLAGRVIAISNWVARFLIEVGLATSERIRIVHYGIETDSWTLGAEERVASRTAFGVAPQEIGIGIASRLIPLKGHDFLFSAFRRAASQVPNLRLLIAGNGPLRDSLEVKARNELPKNSVRFLGFIPNVARFMNACDAIVFPTLPELGEGFGLAALEAMAAGRPVVATRVGSLPEVVADGETGIIVPPDAVEELASALVRLATDSELRARLGACGRERVLRRFSLNAMTEGTLAVYEEALSRAWRVGVA